ncbi:MAG TPA: diguanylate cyclase [Nitrospiraceae bacterium]|nr:diguanylate cyclase [Nitrospiraceae bacterium]
MIHLHTIPLRMKTILTLGGGLFACWAVLTLAQYHMMSRTLAAEWESKSVEYRRAVATAFQPLLQAKDRPSLGRAVSQFALNPDIKSVTVVDAHGVIIADSKGQGIGSHVALHLDALRKGLEEQKTDVSWTEVKDSGRMRFSMTPVKSSSDESPGTSVQGAVLIGVDLSAQDRLIRSNLPPLLLLNGAGFATVLFIVWFAIRIRLIHPLHALAESVRSVPGAPISGLRLSGSSDEIGALTESFARLSEALQESEAFNHATLNSVPAQTAILDKDGYLLSVNAAWEQFAREHECFPFKTGGLLNYIEISSDPGKGYGERAHDAVGGIRAVLNGSLPSFTLDFAAGKGDGRRRFLLTVSALQRETGGAIVSHVDITERTRGEEALEQRVAEFDRARAQLDTVYATIPIGLMYLTPDLIIERLSHRMAQFFGHPLEDQVKKPLQTAVPSERWNRLRRVIEDVVRTGKPSQEIEEAISDPRAPGGMRFFVSYFYPDLGDGGSVQGIHVATLEVTAEKQAQKEREQDLKELKAKNRELDQMAIRDPLTGLYNRRFFDEALTREWQQFQRSGEAFTVIIMDVDAFKAINDDYGHEAGDRALQQVAATLRTNLRESDLVARVGGDEFAALLPRTDTDQGHQVVEKVREILKSLRLMTAEGEIPMSLSLGAATVPGFPPVTSAAELLRVADKRMYDAKRLASSRRADAG